ncbi:geranylgeranyl diphosphate synthase, type I, partial [Streptomyces sp. SolWspMP-5a-2]
PAPGPAPAGPPDRPRAPRPLPRGVSDVRAVDDDVTGAVRRTLTVLLAEREAAARAVDPLFAGDLAARVSRFTVSGGKFGRSRLLWWAGRACGAPGAGAPPGVDSVLRVAAALELIQTCALVHDDVMDAAPVRRGRPALHADVSAQYTESAPGPRGARLGEASAILAGDLALAWADDVVAETDLPPGTARRVRELWRAMRTEMIAGQYLDVHGEATAGRSVDRALRAACLKSARYSVEHPLALGAALAGADRSTTAALRTAGRCVGLAFQLRDDLLDAFGDPRVTGKPTGDDIRAGKPTYLAALAHTRASAASDASSVAVLDATLGRLDASDAEVERVRRVFVSTGARDAVEAAIHRLTARGLRHLDTAGLRPGGRERLAALLRAVASAPRAPDTATPAGPPPAVATGTPTPGAAPEAGTAAPSRTAPGSASGPPAPGTPPRVAEAGRDPRPGQPAARLRAAPHSTAAPGEHPPPPGSPSAGPEADSGPPGTGGPPPRAPRFDVSGGEACP